MYSFNNTKKFEEAVTIALRRVPKESSCSNEPAQCHAVRVT